MLYTFFGYPGDACYPQADLAFDTQGALYGTTMGGGSSGAGTVFKLTPPTAEQKRWTRQLLYIFKGGADGAAPTAGVIFDTQGALYSTTTGGGSANAGTVFKVTPPASGTGPWVKTTLYNFRGGTDGTAPRASLIFDTWGALYGTTTSGGSSNAGTVFKLAPPASGTGSWTETSLYSFKGGNDGFGAGKLIFDAYGALYGITRDGSGQGTVYRLTPPSSGTAWTETVLYSFAKSGGSFGEGLLFDTQGALYGTTWDGGFGKGAVFKLTPPALGQQAWTQTVLYSFVPAPPPHGPGRVAPGADGNEPQAGLIFGRGGALYGTTKLGGSGGQGTVFQISRPGCSN